MLTRYKSTNSIAASKSITASTSIRSSSRKTVKPERLMDIQASVGKYKKDTYVHKLDKPIPQEMSNDGLHGYDGTDGFVVRDFDEHVDAEEEDDEELVQTDDETETEHDDDVELDDDDTEDEEEDDLD
jgi:hypothetical protein